MSNQILLDEVLRMAKNLGPEFEEAIVNTLTNHHPTLCRGKAMTVKETNALKIGDVVWMRYREDPDEELGKRPWRIDQATELCAINSRGELDFSVGGFAYDPDLDIDFAVADWNHGESRLYHVKEKGQKKTKAKK